MQFRVKRYSRNVASKLACSLVLGFVQTREFDIRIAAHVQRTVAILKQVALHFSAPLLGAFRLVVVIFTSESWFSSVEANRWVGVSRQRK